MSEIYLAEREMEIRVREELHRAERRRMQKALRGAGRFRLDSLAMTIKAAVSQIGEAVLLRLDTIHNRSEHRQGLS